MSARAVVLLTCLAACGGARPAKMTGPSTGDLVSHAAALRERLIGTGMSVSIEAPFVVVADPGAARSRRRVETTIRWAVQRLEADYFTRRPRKVVEIWMFHNERAYRRGATRFFGDRPTTPYGYYDAEDDAIVLNIARGMGTLVHEVVHPFVEVDFPDAPVWLNEGLASLFERPTDRGGRIVGRNNWRLPSLKKEIIAGTLPSIDTLLRMPTERFYRASFDTYAYARYLMMYLQDRGVLTEFYTRFKQNVRRDPTGRATLLAVLGQKDMTAVKRSWSRWVLDQGP